MCDLDLGAMAGEGLALRQVLLPGHTTHPAQGEAAGGAGKGGAGQQGGALEAQGGGGVEGANCCRPVHQHHLPLADVPGGQQPPPQGGVLLHHHREAWALTLPAKEQACHFFYCRMSQDTRQSQDHNQI